MLNNFNFIYRMKDLLQLPSCDISEIIVNIDDGTNLTLSMENDADYPYQLSIFVKDEIYVIYRITQYNEIITVNPNYDYLINDNLELISDKLDNLTQRLSFRSYLE